MDDFRMIATGVSMVLGLGMTRLLHGLVTVFRTRSVSPVDWLPLAWAGVLFVTMLQYWWAINRLPLVRASFSFLDFLHIIILTLALFLSAALLLPSRSEDETAGLREFFEKEGRYGLLSFAGFLVIAFTVNVFLYGSSPLSLWGFLDVPMIATPVAVFFIASRTARVWLTAAYGPLLLADVWVSLATD
jgi:hypothetical protein